MAKINREYCDYANALGMYFRVPTNETWSGIGWAHITFDEIGWGKLGGEFCTIIYQGNLYLRVLYTQRSCLGCIYVVEANNWRWPIWWMLLRLWRFAHWFERNLRLTAAIWGLLKYDMRGCIPRWRDFMPLWWWRGRKAKDIKKAWPPQQT